MIYQPNIGVCDKIHFVDITRLTTAVAGVNLSVDNVNPLIE